MNKLLALLAAILLTVSLQAQTRSTYLTQMLVLKEKYDVTFVYDSSLQLDGVCRNVSNRSSMERSVRDLFEESGIDYEIRGHTVILRKAVKETPPDLYAETPSWAFDTLRPSRIESAWVDTLMAAVKTDRMRVVRDLGTLQSDLPAIRGIVSPLGEGDPLRWVQTLPGVASGADGTSALYVRGGNLGNNLFTLDDVPVYGYSHILGLTTVIPSEAIETVELSKGGFEGSQGNFISSHLRIRSRVPGSDGPHTSVAVNNFLASISTEGRRGDSFSYTVSGRISPLALEYGAFNGMLPEMLGGFEGFGAGVGDVYGKVDWSFAGISHLDAFVLGSLDHYRFTSADDSVDSMGWYNAVGSIGYTHDNGGVKTVIRAYVNRYSTAQSNNKLYRDTWQELSLSSNMMEFSLSADRTHYTKGHLSYSYGLRARDASFNPGQVAAASHRSNVVLSSVWLQGDFNLPERLSIMASVRGNAFFRTDSEDKLFSPDAGLSMKWSPGKHISFDATFDRTSQFYHTLEGLPVGWSLDMIVPSGKSIAPETAVQICLGMDLELRAHSLSAGVFHKRMDGLVFYKYAPALFNGALTAWEDQVDTGLGYSYGAESLYEYLGKDFQARVSYTWSRTWREGFASVLDGERFHARFDRTHVLYASAFWKGFNATFSFQSGHWENSMAQQARMHIIDEEWTAKYFTDGGINDYHMPDVLRLDVGYRFSFGTETCKHDFNLGVCNVTNHFNPFMLYFNTSTETWQEIALLPIFPNFSYRITF